MDRAVATKRLEAQDYGVVLRHGDGPDGCDVNGAREAQIFTDGKKFYLHYDGAANDGWAACLAVSDDLMHWEKRGRVLDIGQPGKPDCASASSPWVYCEDGVWHMFYLGTPNCSGAPDYVPEFPYLTLKARSSSPEGPWEKEYDKAPFKTKEGTYYSITSSPGHVVKHNGEYLQFFSSTCHSEQGHGYRTVSLARAKDLNGPWTVSPEPMLPVTEQIENSSVYYEEANGLWFLFTNHISLRPGDTKEYASEAWVYWTDDPYNWNPENKAVILDTTNCTWSPKVIGMPTVLPVDGRLAVFYDACKEDQYGHMRRDIGLAWLDLPLQPPE